MKAPPTGMDWGSYMSLKGPLYGGVGLEDVDVEGEGAVLVLVDELRRPVSQEGGLGELFGQRRRIVAGEDHRPLGLLVRHVPLVHQEVMVVTEDREVLVIGIVLSVLVLDANPLVEPVL